MKKDESKQYIIELVRRGRYLKVSAIDPVTMIEVSVVGGANANSQKLLEKQAVKKLEKKIKEQQE